MTTRALVTNDDGIDSPGLWALARTAHDLGLEVVVASPAWDSSGASASITAVQDDGRLLFERRRHDDLPSVDAFAVQAPPAFIAATAAKGAFGPPPAIVLSGINTGANTGQAILHSGTVGAALTAFTYGCRTMAVSLAADGAPPWHWETAAGVARTALALVVGQGSPMILNVNIPNVPPSELRGFRPARLAQFGLVQTNITEVGKGWVKVGYQPVEEAPAPGTDMARLAEGYACFTALRTVCEADVDTSGLEDMGATTQTVP
ncbi:MAG: 5'/3'-nucleotidase SurE [Acidimicrobiales bacterium]